MPEAPPLTRELALRIEELSTRGALHGAPQRRFGNAVAGKTTEGRPRNYVLGFGHDDIPHLASILAYYAEDAIEPRFSLTPARFTTAVADVLTAAGFRQENYEQAILYGLPCPDPAPLPPGVTIEQATDATLEEFVQTSAEAFEFHPDWRDAAMETVRDTFHEPHQQRFLARCEGQPAGVGRLQVEDGVAGLGGGAVVPRHRRKGVHLALVRHRLHRAHQLGATFVVGGASYNSPSFRNQQRAGLRLAYVECVWARR